MMNALSSSRTTSGDLLPERTLELETPDRPIGLMPAGSTTAAHPAKNPQLVCTQQAPAAEAERRAYWHILRAFFRTAKGGGWPKGTTITPALLAPYQDNDVLAAAFPLWMPNQETWLKSGSSTSFAPRETSKLLDDVVRVFAPEETDSPLLKAQLPRLQRIIAQHVKSKTQGVSAGQLWKDATDTLHKELQLKGVDALMLTGEINQLLKQLPPGGIVLPFDKNTPLLLLAAYLEFDLSWRTAGITTQIDQVLPALRDALAIQKEKQPESTAPDQLRQSLDFASRFVDFDALSEVLPTHAEETGNTRLARLQQALDILENAAHRTASSAQVVVSDALEGELGLDLAELMPHASIYRVATATLFKVSRELYDASAAGYAQVWRALRIAQLELDNQYQPEVHDDFFAQFSDRAFSDLEMSLCPPTVILLQRRTLMGDLLPDFSNCLASNTPLKVVALPDSTSAIAAEAYRLEPAALAIAHRNALVLQASALAPNELLKGFQQGIHRPAPAFFHVLGMGGAEGKSALHTLAAIESRAFPGLSYDPDKGPHWGSRFSLVQNPDMESDWPMHTLEYMVGKEKAVPEQVAFTFADFAATIPGFSSYFHLVDSAYWTDALVPLAAYLNLPVAERTSKVPFIWVTDSTHQLQKAAVAWPLVQIAAQRLDFWKHIQENAGIHSYHVERAAEKLAQEMETTFSQRIQRLEGTHQNDLQQVRDAAARDAMERLASVLLELDMDTLDLSPATSVSVAAKPTPAAAAPPVVQASAPTDAVAPQATPTPAPVAAPTPTGPIEIAAWIDTSLCTSCSECVDSEPGIFAYNDDKQAYVANPRGGSFADLVKAAERCPVSIIHPGTPWDKDDPDLTELLERAKPFE